MLRVVVGVVLMLAAGSEAYAEQPVCFSRKYDAGHLARYPQQTVTSMNLALKEQSGEYQIAVTRRGSTVIQYNAGHCDPGTVKGKDGLFCHAEIECDGDCGSVGVVFESRNSVLVHFSGVTKSFLLNSTDGHAYIKPELDDGVFRLGREASCAFNADYQAQVPNEENEIYHYACRNADARYGLSVNTQKGAVELRQYGPPRAQATLKIEREANGDECGRFGWKLSEGLLCTFTQGVASLEWQGREFECDLAGAE